MSWSVGGTNIYFQYKKEFLCLVVVLLCIAASFKLSDEFFRLTYSTDISGAIDLRILKVGINKWFNNEPYHILTSSLYPPATYITIWPVIGWTSFQDARYILAVLYIPTILLISIIFYRYSLASSREESYLSFIMPLSINALAVSIGNGQLTAVCLTLMICSILFLKSGNNNIAKQVLICLLIIVAMIRPTATVPFFFILLFVFDKKRIFHISVFSYVLITFISLYLRQMKTPEIITTALNIYNSVDEVIIHGSDTGGYANIHSLLIYFGMERYNILASLISALILGIWVHRNRNSDLWILLGVTAIFSRLWVYHKVYDDVLLFIPMITLFRLTKSCNSQSFIKNISFILLGITTVSMIMPATIFQHIDYYDYFFKWTHIINWLAVLIFLVSINQYFKSESISGFNIQNSSV